jgi:hypothetical protein
MFCYLCCAAHSVRCLPRRYPAECRRLEHAPRVNQTRIVIELETPGDSRSLFRLRLDNKVVGEHLTAVQAHLLVGEILDRITLPQ